MSKRMIDSSVWRSENFVSLPPMARLLMMGMITTADDQGRLQASPMFMRGDFFPGDDDATTKSIQTWLEMLYANKTIILYSVDGKQYAQFANWWKYQSLRYPDDSIYPPPDGWADRKSEIDSSTQAYIYIMVDESTGFYKIGRTNNPIKRESTLQSEKPTIRLVAKVKRNKKYEQKLHKQYKNNRIRGEWFSLTTEEVEGIVDGFMSSED